MTKVQHLSVGVVECSLVGATLWCTNLLIGPDGRLLSKHRKLQPTAAERVVWSQGEGSHTNKAHHSLKSEGKEETLATDNLPVVQTAIGRIGGLICWESESSVSSCPTRTAMTSRLHAFG